MADAGSGAEASDSSDDGDEESGDAPTSNGGSTAGTTSSTSASSGVTDTTGATSGTDPAGTTSSTDPSGTSSSTMDATSDPTSDAPSDLSAAEVVARIGVGWNLGNSLDVPEGETAWGNPRVEEALIQAVADAGFGGIRIPVTWSLHLGPGPDYTIEPAWLDRVEEVVGFATSRDLYTIINLHHDGADEYEGVEWLTLNDASGAVTPENNAAVAAQFEAVWAQIAARFAAHGHLLIFESMNEIHDGYGDPNPVYHDIINDLNQRFVDLVRGSGGNNATRYLVVPGYNTNIDHTLTGFEAPVDTLEDRLILSVHYYDPYEFALNAEPAIWGAQSSGTVSWGTEDWVLGQFQKIGQTYVQQGLPVIVGEYGATHRDGYEDYRRYYMEYVTKVAVDAGAVPFYWDNGGRGSGPDNFAIFDRTTNTAFHPEILEAIMRAATSDYSLSDIVLPAG